MKERCSKNRTDLQPLILKLEVHKYYSNCFEYRFTLTCVLVGLAAKTERRAGNILCRCLVRVSPATAANTESALVLTGVAVSCGTKYGSTARDLMAITCRNPSNVRSASTLLGEDCNNRENHQWRRQDITA